MLRRRVCRRRNGGYFLIASGGAPEATADVTYNAADHVQSDGAVALVRDGIVIDVVGYDGDGAVPSGCFETAPVPDDLGDGEALIRQGAATCSVDTGNNIVDFTVGTISAPRSRADAPGGCPACATATPTPSPTPAATPSITATTLPLAPLDVDGDGALEVPTDGRLVLRYLFGFRGAVLIAGSADTQNCTRCNATDLETYLASILTQLDIDGDGEIGPLSDGLVILRYLFAFRGDALVMGAVDTSDCTRCDATAIEEYLAALV